MIPRPQDRLKSGIKVPSTISTLAKHCLSIYKQIQATDRIREKAKFSTTIRIAINVLLRVVTSFSQELTVFNNNTFFSYLFNTLQGIITPTCQNLDTEISRLMKKERCFNYKQREHTMLYYPEKAKISGIIDVSNVDNIENID